MQSLLDEITASRLSMLSDLAESRKRAERQEHEFLEKLQRENAAFRALASDLQGSLSLARDEGAEKARFHQQTTLRLESRIAELEARLHESGSRAQEQVTKSSKEFEAALMLKVAEFESRLSSKLEALRTESDQKREQEAHQRDERVEVLTAQILTLADKVVAVEESVKGALGWVEAQMGGVELQVRAASETTLSVLQSVEGLRLAKDGILADLAEMKAKEEELLLLRKSVSPASRSGAYIWQVKLDGSSSSHTVQSEVFGVDGYLFTRCFFQLLSREQDLTVMFCWEPLLFSGSESSNAVLRRVIVDLMVNEDRKQSISGGERPDLPGLVVWEATFSNVRRGDIPVRIGVEIGGTSNEEDGESVVTFGNGPRSITPRRANWTQFGSGTQSNSPLHSSTNPFAE